MLRVAHPNKMQTDISKETVWQKQANFHLEKKFISN